MKRENVKKNIGIISAFADGKTIQILNERGEWVDLTEREGLPIGILEEEPNNFRTKPEPKYRPFKDAEECWQEMLKHQPFGWIKGKEDEYHTFITTVDNTLSGNSGWSFLGIMNNYTFADGTPFGMKEEE
nr:hypothetical protein [Prevotella sp.]